MACWVFAIGGSSGATNYDVAGMFDPAPIVPFCGELVLGRLDK
jgi:hypothetical protein